MDGIGFVTDHDPRIADSLQVNAGMRTNIGASVDYQTSRSDVRRNLKAYSSVMVKPVVF
jgi:hypothetical protein